MTFNKKLNFEFIIGDDNLKDLGFQKVSIFDKNIVINFSDGRTPILSKFKVEELESTMKTLEKKLIMNDIGKDSLQRLSAFVVQELLKKVDELESEEKAASANTDVQKILDEIAKDKSAVGQISTENWQSGLKERYQTLQQIVKRNIPELWSGLEFELSVLRILNIECCTLPFIGILLGRPSSGKTIVISVLRKWYCTFYTDNFTAKAFVSHSTAVSKDELKEIDMLPKIKNKLFLTPELSPTFTAKDDDLNQLLGIITRIADGQGLVTDSGAHGHRGYDEDIMFVWVGAAVDMPFKVYKLLGNLGAKLYFFRLPSTNKTEDLFLAQTKEDHNGKIKKITEALFDYLKWFDVGPDMTIDKSSSLPKIKWNDKKDDEQAIRYIIKVAKLLSHLRCVATTWHTEDSQGSDYAYSVSQPEDPSRAITVLSNLAKGHALLTGRNYISKDDVPIVVKTVLSTAQIERVSLFDLLLANGGKLTTTRIVESLNISRPTALRTMAEFKAIGLVDKEQEVSPLGGSGNIQITLKDEFNWFLSEEFQKLRDGFKPTDNTEYLKEGGARSVVKVEQEGRKEKIPPTTTNISLSTSTDNVDDYNNNSNKEQAKEKTFWQIYGDLEQKQQQQQQQQQQTSDPNITMDVDKNTLSGQEIKNRLISSGKFFAGDAFQMLEDMTKKGKLEKVAFDTYKRKESGSNN
jgi:hypothetical protein